MKASEILRYALDNYLYTGDWNLDSMRIYAGAPAICIAVDRSAAYLCDAIRGQKSDEAEIAAIRLAASRAKTAIELAMWDELDGTWTIAALGAIREYWPRAEGRTEADRIELQNFRLMFGEFIAHYLESEGD